MARNSMTKEAMAMEQIRELFYTRQQAIRAEVDAEVAPTIPNGDAIAQEMVTLGNRLDELRKVVDSHDVHFTITNGTATFTRTYPAKQRMLAERMKRLDTLKVETIVQFAYAKDASEALALLRAAELEAAKV